MMTEEKKPGLIAKIKFVGSILVIAVLVAMISSVTVVYIFDCMRVELFLMQEFGWSSPCSQ